MKQTRAIITLTIGSTSKATWQRFCQENWSEYAQRHGYDLVAFDRPLDTTPRATKRSASWQKCLVLCQPEIAGYEQVVWVDSDVLFNVCDAPSICDSVPARLVGAVDSFSDPTPTENRIALERLFRLSEGKVAAYSSPEEIYRRYDLALDPPKRMLNAGVLVISPIHHADLFKYVYDNYDDRGSPSYYENVPLSYELVSRDLVFWLDPRFNHLWAWSKQLHYGFLLDYRGRSFRDKVLRRVAQYLGNNYENRMRRACATAALLNSYCLHFAGAATEISLVDQRAAASGHLGNLGIPRVNETKQ